MNEFLMSESLAKLAPDLVGLQADLEPLTKTASNPFFHSKYAPLPDVAEALKPVLAKHHFSMPVFPTLVESAAGPTNGLRFFLLHKSGEFMSGVWMLRPAQNTPQGEGADVTYKRRFAIQAISGLVADEDDDGNTASRAPQARPAPAKRTEADVKRDQLRHLANQRGWELEKVAAAFATKVNGGGGDLKEANAKDIAAFIVSLESGAVTV